MHATAVAAELSSSSQAPADSIILRKSYRRSTPSSLLSITTILFTLILVVSIMSLAAATKQQKYSERGKSSSYAASETSFYTTEEKKDFYSTLSEILETKCADPLVRRVIHDLMKVCADITQALRTALVTVEGTSNDFGDSQLSVDVRYYYFVGCYDHDGDRSWARGVCRVLFQPCLFVIKGSMLCLSKLLRFRPLHIIGILILLFHSTSL
jgi:hypothetical protein